MSEFPRELLELPGCTPLQRQLFRESVRRGRPLPLVHVESSVADVLRQPSTMLADLDEGARRDLLDAWSAEDVGVGLEARWKLDTHARKMPPRWAALLPDLVQRDRAGVEVGDRGLARLVRSLSVRGAAPAETRPVPESLRLLIELERDHRDSWLVAVGVGLVASGRDMLGARRTARLMMAANESERWAAGAIERTGFEPSEHWSERYRELLVGLADHDPRERLRRMGVYVVAMAASRELGGQAFPDVAEQLPAELWALIESYADSVRRSSRRGLGTEAEVFLSAIEELPDD